MASATSYATSGGRLRETTRPGRIVADDRAECRGLPGGEHHLERGERHRAHDRHAANGHGDVDRPVGARHLAEFPRPVERVDDPEPTVARHVLETLLGADVIRRVEPIQLAHQQAVGQPVAGGTDVPHVAGVAPELHEGLSGQGGQQGRVAVLVGKVLGHGPSF